MSIVKAPRPQPRSARRAVACAAVVVAGVLPLAAGCGDDEGTSDVGEPPTVGMTRSAPAAPAPSSAAAGPTATPVPLSPQSKWYGLIDLTVYLCSDAAPALVSAFTGRAGVDHITVYA